MLAGIHGDNRRFWSEESFRRLALARPQLVKMLTCNDLSVFRRVRALLPETKLMTRLFWPGRPPAPQRFCDEMAPLMQEIAALGGDTFELLNEPNTPWEGFGPGGAAEFDDWALEAMVLLKRRLPVVRLLWPALCVNPEYNDEGWWQRCWRSMWAADGVAAHAYWQPDWAMFDRQWGLRFLRLKDICPRKPLWITEAGCTDRAVSKERRGELYPRYTRRLRTLGVEGVAFWLLSGTDEWEARENAFFDDGMARALGAVAAEGETPPAMKTLRVGNMDGVIDLRGRLSCGREYGWRALGDIRYLVVHHSGVAVDSAAEAVARYHTQVLGWPGIGYHFLVHQDGRCEYVGDVCTTRANVAGRNHEVAGVCLLGDFTRVPPGEPQLTAARRLLANLQFDAITPFQPTFEPNNAPYVPSQRRFANILLTKLFSGGVFMPGQHHFVEGGGGRFLKAGDRVTVGVDRHLDASVP